MHSEQVMIMMNSVTRTALALGTLMMLALGPLSNGLHAQFAGNPDKPHLDQPPSKAITSVRIDQMLQSQIPLDLTFRDESGKEVKLGDYWGDKPVILILAYYECPMLCTQVFNGLVKCAKFVDFDMGDDYQVVTVSINPGDTPELAKKKKKNYVEQYGRNGLAQKGWHFLTTPDTATIKKLADAVGFHYTYDPKTGTYAHASAIMVSTKKGVLSHYFYGIDYSPKDVKYALIEAAKGQIGSPTNAIVYLCYQYDPKSGSYGLVVMRVLQLAGVATIGLLGGFMIFWLRRDRKKQREATA